jgi:lysophospholipase L1-like esterase
MTNNRRIGLSEDGNIGDVLTKGELLEDGLPTGTTADYQTAWTPAALVELLQSFKPSAMPVAMSSAPTVTFPTGDAATTISSAASISLFNGTPGAGTLNTHRRFGLSGTPMRYRSTPIDLAQTANGSGVSGWSYISGYYYGSKVEFNLIGMQVGTATYQVYVDDVPVTVDPVSVTTAVARYRLSVAFGAAGLRKITLAIGTGFGIDVIQVGPTDTWAPAPYRSVPIGVVGDSFATGGASQSNGWAQRLHQLCPPLDLNAGIFSGTGFTTSNGYGADGRVALIAETNPVLILFQGSTNDSSATQAELTAAVIAAIAAYRTACPRARFMITGPIGRTATYAAFHARMEIAAAAAGATFVHTIGTGAGQDWLTGTGRVGATTGTGNSDLFVTSDALHPTQAGTDYIAMRLAAAIAAL